MVSDPSQSSSFVLCISDEVVRHIDSKHAQDRYERPLWLEFLGSTADIASVLLPEIHRSIHRPLFVEYDQYDSNAVFLHQTRECVTRAGIVAIVRRTDNLSGDLVTAFFPYETFDARRQRRWMAARESRIKVYACRVTFGRAQTLLVPPSPDDVFPSADPPGERRNVRFVDDAHWGIRNVEVTGTTCLAFGKPPAAWPEE